MNHSKMQQNHMKIHWKEEATQVENIPILKASLREKAFVVGRTGLLLLSCGTGAWRIRSSMNTLAEKMGITCTVNIGFMSLDYSCMDERDCFSQSLCLTNNGVNTAKLYKLESFVADFMKEDIHITSAQIQKQLDEIESTKGLYSPIMLGLSAALACGSFTFLLGGGVVEIICAFCGAFCGNYIRIKQIKKNLTLFLNIIVSVSVACMAYTAALLLLQRMGLAFLNQHEAGYVCAMLFIIPGFPFITSGIDMAKLDMRSGLERLAYSLMIIIVASITAWGMALLLQLTPTSFSVYTISLALKVTLRLIFSFCGVFGFSMMFNSSYAMSFSAAMIGAVANTFRLELVDLTKCPVAVAAFLGSLVAGLLASALKNQLRYPRISITVPSIVIMVPGLYLYRAVYNLGIMSLTVAASYFASAIMILLAIPLGLITARIITDKSFRYCT